MKIGMSAMLSGAAMLAACGASKEKQAAADANAAGFTPPAVTSRTDFASAMDRRFRALDRNGDDRLSRDEWPRRDSRLTELDRNGDGAVTTIEWGDGMVRRFDRLDLNHDGTLTSEEQAAAREGDRQATAAPATVSPGDTQANAAAPER